MYLFSVLGVAGKKNPSINTVGAVGALMFTIAGLMELASLLSRGKKSVVCVGLWGVSEAVRLQGT